MQKKMQTKLETPEILSAVINDYNSISVFFTAPVGADTAARLSFFDGDKVAEYHVEYVSDNKVVLRTNRLNIKKPYFVAINTKKVEVIPHYILDKEEFIYRGSDLGLTYSPQKSVFKVWAPTATRIILNIFDDLDGMNKQVYDLSETERGVWQIEINGDLKGKVYSFGAEGALSTFNINREITDPYSRCVLGNTRRSLVCEISSPDEISDAPDNFPIKDAIIYECHVRDISIDVTSGLKHNFGKYTALTYPDTKCGDTPTLLSHFKDLGVNTIQIMPIQDFDNDESDHDFYGWGYMPKNFNSPDGAYASDWKTDAKINEVRQMVDALHKAGLKVTLDVVYNHTAEGFFGDGIQSFNGFVPYYYYRIAGNGYVSNGSGCGNEFRSESPMGRKFIIDSLRFWTEYYKFDGYRFDLMGLIDIDTCRAVVHSLRQINPNIFVYGEPWTGGLTPIQPTYKGAQRGVGFSVFNDDFRDAIKGAVFNKFERGFVQSCGNNSYDRMITGIRGSIDTFAAIPSESLNYAEVHDNNTLFDKLFFTETGSQEYREPNDDEINRIKALDKLTAFILLTSQGVPVMHLGQDFMRTKFGVENSYNSGDHINAIDWTRKARFFDVFRYYQGLIRIRNEHPLFRMFSSEEIHQLMKFINDFPAEYMHCIKYMLKNGEDCEDKFHQVMILINPYPNEVYTNLGGNWHKLLIGDTFFDDNDNEVIYELRMPPLSGCILYQKNE